MERWDENFIRARYHLAIAERMYKSFPEFDEKRIIVGIIREIAKSASFLVRAFLVREASRGNIILRKNYKRNFKIFIREIAPKYNTEEEIKTVLKIFEIERSQKDSPVEFLRGQQIGFMVGGNYKFLRSERLGEFLKNLRSMIKRF